MKWWNKSAVMTTVSIVGGVLLWQIAGMLSPVLVASPVAVLGALLTGLQGGPLVLDIVVSLTRVIEGFLAAFAASVLVGFLLGWYRTPRMLFDPWVQFFRMIPPIAMIPLVIVYLGVGQVAKVFVIFLAAFLVMVVTIYQGVKQVDMTLIRAARVLGCRDADLFVRVIMPASIPHIFTAVRLGIAAAWTTLVASELIAASHGLGVLIEQASNYFEMPLVYLGILIIGVIGILMDRGVLWLERSMTSWQEKIQ